MREDDTNDVIPIRTLPLSKNERHLTDTEYAGFVRSLGTKLTDKPRHHHHAHNELVSEQGSHLIASGISQNVLDDQLHRDMEEPHDAHAERMKDKDHESWLQRLGYEHYEDGIKREMQGPLAAMVYTHLEEEQNVHQAAEQQRAQRAFAMNR